MNLLTLVIASAALSTTSSTLPLKPGQAGALLERHAVDGRSNAFDDLWLLPYDVPEADKHATVEADLLRINRILDATDADDAPLQMRQLDSIAAERYPASPAPLSDAPALCRTDRDDCLQRVRADTDGFVRVLQHERALLSRLQAVTKHDHFRSRFTPHTASPMLPVRRIELPLTQSALDHVQGRTDVALTGLCQRMTGWRRLGARSDSVVLRTISAALIQADASLYAQILVDAPDDLVEPATCAAAFTRADETELSLCAAMTGEYAMMRHYFTRIVTQNGDTLSAKINRAMLDREHTVDLMAQHLAWQCTDAARAQRQTDTPVTTPRHEIDPLQGDCLKNFTGCTLAKSAHVSMDPYAHRLQDMAARLRLVDALRSLRRDCRDRPVQACLDEVNTAQAATARPIGLADDGRSLQVRLYATPPGSPRTSHARVALPSALIAAR